MNDLILSDSDTILKMDSREISELTGKRHDHVLRDIESMLLKLEGLPKFGEIYLDSYNRPQKCFKLPKRETLILVSGYSVELRAKIIDRLEYLEKKNKPSLPESFADALLLAYNQQKQIEQQQEQIKLQTPKVEYYEKVLNTETCYTTMQIAKEHSLTANKLNDLLKSKKIIFKKSGQWMLLDKYSRDGLTKTRTATFKNKAGDNETSHYTVWTEKGRKFIGEVISDNSNVLKGLL